MYTREVSIHLGYPEEPAIGDRFPELGAYEKVLPCSHHTKHHVNANIVLMPNDISNHGHIHPNKKIKQIEKKEKKEISKHNIFSLAILRVLLYQSNSIYCKRLPRSTIVTQKSKTLIFR